MRRLTLLLIVAGVCAAVFSQLGAIGDVTLFGADDETDGPLGLGPEWIHRVPDVAGGLGLSAALCGVLAWRWPDRVVAGIVAVLLALGTAFVVWWLLAPPVAIVDAAGEDFAYPWWMWVNVAALVVATIAAAALTRARTSH